MKIAFDIDVMKPGCAIIQAAMGGTEGVASAFPVESWQITPTPGMKLREITPEQLIQLVEMVEIAPVQ